VYSGSGLRGYGKLIIIKHNRTYLSAYAHNDKILVKEGQSVTLGQKIALMGNTDADRVELHFEVRRLGKPVDPAKYLPIGKSGANTISLFLLSREWRIYRGFFARQNP